ncbi:hypothetical protein Q4543_13450 [Salipiger sp. 1_MG-2023]|uniref:nickel/cobalt transporter n=1 Tax=Salipiger sp. 1_MG-2023 TaxID=3062665 RepID=UPI0026E3B7F8|nr:hypothetical protein [Salipiger sp. 1_MG-2023]MDO6586518.1 hypothetical protein [Salipiger sp. 1_MG-2023]
MRSVGVIGAALVAALALWLWAGDGAAQVARLAAAGQHEAQVAMARALRALRAGDPGALSWLLAMCFAYGVLHAAGPGHGKLLVGGYGVGRRVPLARLSALALVSSLAQAGVAIAVVYTGAALLGLGRVALTDAAEDYLAPASYAAIGCIGLWLLLRGLRKLPAPKAHVHDHHCDCGHAHAPTTEQVETLHGLRDAALLVAAIAIRPCTGALFLLILTWRMNLDLAGILGVTAMGLGTGAVTVAVAAASVTFREGALMRLASGAQARRVMGGIEATAGALIAMIAFEVTLRTVL